MKKPKRLSSRLEEEGKLDKQTQRWLGCLRKGSPELLRRVGEIIEDQDIYGGLIELSSRHGIPLSEILARLEDWRRGYLPDIEVRAKLRAIGKLWKDVGKKASKALKESEPFFDNPLKGHAIEVIRTAGLLSKFGLEPQASRPRDAEIAECKVDIRAFLKRRGVRGVNEYGWLLLRAVFPQEWRAGRGKDQIGAFRKISASFSGRVQSRKDALAVMERAKVDITGLEVAARSKKQTK